MDYKIHHRQDEIYLTNYHGSRLIDIRYTGTFVGNLINEAYVAMNNNRIFILNMENGLQDDLLMDFPNLAFIDIENGFRDGVRNTDLFALNVKTYYKWIKSHRQ